MLEKEMIQVRSTLREPKTKARTHARNLEDCSCAQSGLHPTKAATQEPTVPVSLRQPSVLPLVTKSPATCAMAPRYGRLEGGGIPPSSSTKMDAMTKELKFLGWAGQFAINSPPSALSQRVSVRELLLVGTTSLAMMTNIHDDGGGAGHGDDDNEHDDEE